MVHSAQSIKWAKHCFDGLSQGDPFVIITHDLHILAEGVRPETKYPPELQYTDDLGIIRAMTLAYVFIVTKAFPGFASFHLHYSRRMWRIRNGNGGRREMDMVDREPFWMERKSSFVYYSSVVHYSTV